MGISIIHNPSAVLFDFSNHGKDTYVGKRIEDKWVQFNILLAPSDTLIACFIITFFKLLYNVKLLVEYVKPISKHLLNETSRKTYATFGNS